MISHRAGAQVARAAHGAHPGCFAMVMATGIVSAALRLAGRPHLSVVLLAIAVGGFAVLAAVSAWRGRPGGLVGADLSGTWAPGRQVTQASGH